jgi:biopolymer transport protein ExbB
LSRADQADKEFDIPTRFCFTGITINSFLRRNKGLFRFSIPYCTYVGIIIVISTNKKLHLPKIIKPMFDILLQVDTLSKATEATAAAKESVWGLLMKGGPLMIPLFILFGIAVFVFIERLIVVRKVSKIADNFMSMIRDNIVTGNIAAARSLSKNTDNPIARMIDKGIQRIGKPIDAIEKSMDNVGKLEMYKMERNLTILSVIARIAPLFGFVGTIVGLVLLLKDFATIANPSVSQIADAMYVKLITSASGLIIGMLAYLGYSFLDTQINRTANRMEAASSEFIDILQEPTR